MKTNLTAKELKVLKTSLDNSIKNVEHSKDYTHETYPLKRKKLDEFQTLKAKLTQMQQEI